MVLAVVCWSLKSFETDNITLSRDFVSYLFLNFLRSGYEVLRFFILLHALRQVVF